MALVCKIGAFDYGPAGQNVLRGLRLAGGGYGEIGTALITLQASGGEYTIADKQQVWIYETGEGGIITHRWFGGFVSRVKTTLLKGSSERVWLVLCQDWNLLLDRIVGRAAPA